MPREKKNKTITSPQLSHQEAQNPKTYTSIQASGVSTSGLLKVMEKHHYRKEGTKKTQSKNNSTIALNDTQRKSLHLKNTHLAGAFMPTSFLKASSRKTSPNGRNTGIFDWKGLEASNQAVLKPRESRRSCWETHQPTKNFTNLSCLQDATPQNLSLIAWAMATLAAQAPPLLGEISMEAAAGAKTRG